MDRPLIAETVALTLNHGVYLARIVPTVAEAAALLGAWRPHLAVVDLDLGDGGLLHRLGIAADGTAGTTVPVLGPTRRGDLKTKLAAFDQGVDDANVSMSASTVAEAWPPKPSAVSWVEFDASRA
jgi:DNA-binding response OmpR family regulator